MLVQESGDTAQRLLLVSHYRFTQMSQCPEIRAADIIHRGLSVGQGTIEPARILIAPEQLAETMIEVVGLPILGEQSLEACKYDRRNQSPDTAAVDRKHEDGTVTERQSVHRSLPKASPVKALTHAG